MRCLVLLRLAAAVLLVTAAAAQGQPLPVGKTVTLREDNAIWYVDGRQRIQGNVTLTSLRACRIAARGEGAVIEVEGALDLRAATGGEIVIDGVWIEPWTGCKGLTLLDCRFEGEGGLRTASSGPADTDVVLRSSKFRGKSRLDLSLLGGRLSVMSCGFAAPAAILGATSEHKERNSLELVLLGCHGKDLGFQGGLRLEGVKEALVRNQGLTDYRATGAELGTTYYLALLAETYGRSGQVREGLTVVGEALAIADKNAEHYYDAELYRLKGELTLAQSSVQRLESSVKKEAEECFLKAIEIARKQQAKSLELRATVSLARLLQQQGKKAEAHEMLSEIYNWFTEGFDTKDLQEAKALLESLESSV